MEGRAAAGSTAFDQVNCDTGMIAGLSVRAVPSTGPARAAAPDRREMRRPDGGQRT
jgi:hypothetical protein